MTQDMVGHIQTNNGPSSSLTRERERGRRERRANVDTRHVDSNRDRTSGNTTAGSDENATPIFDLLWNNQCAVLADEQARHNELI